MLLLNFSTLDTIFSSTLPLSPSIWGRVLGPTILVTYWKPPSALRLYKVHILVSLIHTTLFFLASSILTPLLSISPWYPMPRSPMPTPIAYWYLSSLSFPQSVLRSCYEIYLALSSLSTSPTNFISHKGAPPELLTYKS